MSEPNIQEGQPEILTRTPPTFIHARRPESLNQVEVETEIKAMLADPGHPVNNAGDVRHELAHKRLVQLYERRERIEGGSPPPDPANEQPLVALPTGDGVPPGFQWDVPEVNRHVKTLERFGIDHAEFQSVFHQAVRRMEAVRAGRESADGEAAEEALRGELGEDHDATMFAARLFLKTLGEGTWKSLWKGGVLNDVRLVRWAAGHGEKLVPLHFRKLEIDGDPDFMSLENPVKHAALVKERLDIVRQLLEGPGAA